MLLIWFCDEWYIVRTFMMQQEVGVSEETTEGTVKAHNKQDLCVCVMLTQLAAALIMNMEETGKSWTVARLQLLKEKHSFTSLKTWYDFITQLDVRLKESSRFPPCSCPHGRWPRPAPWPSSSITIHSPPCLSFLCQLLGQAIRRCQGATASFPNPDKINAVGLNQSFCNVTLRKHKRNTALKQSSLHTVDVLFTATFLRAIVFSCCTFTPRQPSLSVGVKTKREITPVKGEKWSNQVEMTSPRLACTLNNSCASGAIRR